MFGVITLAANGLLANGLVVHVASLIVAAVGPVLI